MKKGLAITLACVMGVSLIGCSTPGKTSTKENDEKKEKVFRYSMLTDVTTLDPQKCNELLSSTIGYHIGEGLTRSTFGNCGILGCVRRWADLYISSAGCKIQ